MDAVPQGRATLIVDDEEDMRVLLRAVITSANEGLRVSCEASDGDEAVIRWRECRPDIIILDQRMPRVSGLEAAEQILKESPTEKIVLFSAFMNDGLRARAGKVGVTACLSKEQIDTLPTTLWALSD